MYNRAESIADNLKDELVELSRFIYENPEPGGQEFKSSRAHIDLLKKHGFTVEEEYSGIKTAFRAEFELRCPGPVVGYLAEYDALPDIGHGCGHNLLGTAGTGAAIILSKLLEENGGKVVVIGTPAEETDGAKVEMAAKGAFDDLDVALVAHPGVTFQVSGASLALEALEFTYTGKAAHSANNPEQGINALDACINTFNAINALRQHILSDARIHGIIKEGGRAPNIVPDLAVARFYVRAGTKDYLEALSEKVKNCARAGALSTGAGLEISNFEATFANQVTNKALSDVFQKNLALTGVDEVEEAGATLGSSDVGNVSQVCPTIQPQFGIIEGDSDLNLHSRGFAEMTLTETATGNMLKTAIALALTGADVISDTALLQGIKDEFEAVMEKGDF